MTRATFLPSFLPNWGDIRASGVAFVDVAYNIEYGEETSRQNVANLLGLLGFGGARARDFWIYGESDERFKIEGGNEQIALAQADFVGGSSKGIIVNYTGGDAVSSRSVTTTYTIQACSCV